MKMIPAFTLLAAVLSCTAMAVEETDLQTGRIIQKSRTVNSPIDTVWWKWTTHDGLRTFFGEDNMMELRVGGPFEIYFSMEAPQGSRGSEGCKVISYLPKEMISFSWNAPPKFPDIRNGEYHTWVVVNLTPLKDNQTKVRINHLGWPQGEDWNQVYEYFDKAWDLVLDELEKSCQR